MCYTLTWLSITHIKLLPVTHCSCHSVGFLLFVPVLNFDHNCAVAFYTTVTMASRAVGDELKELVFLLLGPSGGDKSTAGNFLAGEALFPIRGTPSAEETTQCNFKYKDMNVRLIDTVGFNEMTRSDREVQIELTTAVLMAADAGGVHQFLICVNVASYNPLPILSADVVSALHDVDRMRTIWPDVMLLITRWKVWLYTKTTDRRNISVD